MAEPVRLMSCPRCHGAGDDPEVDEQLVVCIPCRRCEGKRRVADVQLAPHFWLSEMLESPLAEKLSIPNEPTPEIVEALRELATDCLEPLRDQFGPLRITSGFRAEELNAVLDGASSTSVHPTGHAADLRPVAGGTRLADMVAWIKGSRIPYDQAICEPNWVHIGRRLPGGKKERRQTLLMFRVRSPATGKLVSNYAQFDPKHPALTA